MIFVMYCKKIDSKALLNQNPSEAVNKRKNLLFLCFQISVLMGGCSCEFVLPPIPWSFIIRCVDYTNSLSIGLYKSSEQSFQ